MYSSNTHTHTALAVTCSAAIWCVNAAAAVAISMHSDGERLAADEDADAGKLSSNNCHHNSRHQATFHVVIIVITSCVFIVLRGTVKPRAPSQPMIMKTPAQ